MSDDPVAHTAADLDEMLAYIVEHVHHFDSIRRRDGRWSMQVWLYQQASDPPIRFIGDTFTSMLEAAFDAIVRWRIELHSTPLRVASERLRAELTDHTSHVPRRPG